jgi:hypothetical protein
MAIKMHNVLLVLKDQGPFKRFIKNLMKGHVFGLLSKRSHLRDDGTPKVKYNSKETAIKSAQSLMKKRGHYFSNYKCLYCDGYHLGKNRENPRKEKPIEKSTG